MDCDAIRPHLAAYALGALAADDEEGVARHLAGCAACRAESATLDEAATSLIVALAAVSSHVPPAGLRERLLAAVSAAAGDASATVAASPAAAAVPWPNHAGNGDALRRTTAVRAPAEATRRPVVPLWRRPLAWGGLAAALLIAISFAWGVRLSDALDRERALRESVTGFYSSQQAIVFEVVDSAETTRRVLLPAEGSDFPTRPYGKLFTRADMHHVVVMANRLPSAPAGQSYHLWVAIDGRTQHAGVLTPDADGFAVFVFDADRPGPFYSAAWIALQPTDATEPGGMTIVAWSEGAA